MPQRTGPATAKKAVKSTAGPSDTNGAASSPPEAKEPVEDPIEEQAADTAEPDAAEPDSDSDESTADEGADKIRVDQNPGERAKEDIAKMYPPDTELWYGAVKGLWFGFPRITTITPKRQWLRQIYQLTEVAQTFEWMVLAKVPPMLQARTDALTDDEYNALFNAWFTDSEVSLPK